MRDTNTARYIASKISWIPPFYFSTSVPSKTLSVTCFADFLAFFPVHHHATMIGESSSSNPAILLHFFFFLDSFLSLFLSRLSHRLFSLSHIRSFLLFFPDLLFALPKAAIANPPLAASSAVTLSEDVLLSSFGTGQNSPAPRGDEPLALSRPFQGSPF